MQPSTGYTIGFAAAVCIVCSIFVSGSAVALKDKQDENKDQDQNKDKQDEQKKEDKKDQNNDDKQENRDKQQDKKEQQQQNPNKISKQNAQQMLEALKSKEQETQMKPYHSRFAVYPDQREPSDSLFPI